MSAPAHRDAAPTATSPDGDLIAQCDEFADLSRRLHHIYNVEFLHDDDASEAAAEPLRGRQNELRDLICGARATTFEGVKARGRMMVAYQGAADQFPHGPWPDSMIDALLRDLTGPVSRAPVAAGMPDDRGGYIGLRRAEERA